MTQRARVAELSSTVGAGILGTGIGVILAQSIAGLGPAIALVGLALHAWGMADRRALEHAAGARRPAWSMGLYWTCWLALAALIAYGALNALSR